MSDPAVEAARRAYAARSWGRAGVLMIDVEVAREALKPIHAALDHWHRKYVHVLPGYGVTERCEMICMDALTEIGELVDWEPADE